MSVSFTKVIITLTIIFYLPTQLFAQANNACNSAAIIVSDSACVTGLSQLTTQTLTGATADGYTLPLGCGFIAGARDVWYSFIAKTKTPTITISNVGSGWGGINNVKIQILSGSCGTNTFTSEIACGQGPTLSPSLTNPLLEGTTYFIRIHKNTTVAIGTNHTFDICVTDAFTKAGRMNEVFSQTILSAAGVLSSPWEVTYGADNNLWVTESKGYKVYRINPNTGVRSTVLDISQNATFLPLAERTFNCQFANGAGAQGGLAGLALHPNFLDGTVNENNSVYISYIHSSGGGSAPTGKFFTNRLVRFIYNVGTNQLESPVSLCDTLPGSNDHNSQRMIIAPVTIGGPKFLFYASGDMGAGQFDNRTRPMKAQALNSYEGKILRFNLVSDGDAGFNAWIPNNNPFSATNAVWCNGIRNNQGFAYDAELNLLYGSSHGPYSDDEVNIIQEGKNYGHPFVIGYADDGNYNGNLTPGTSTSLSAGASFNSNSGISSCPPIGNETTRKNELNTLRADSYRDPVFSAYNTTPANITNIWSTTTGANGSWPSEGWSGLDLYTNNIIPGWKKSLVNAGLKWGRLIRMKLNATGDTTVPSRLRNGNSGDTVTYFQSTNRYRDLAFAPNGKDLYLVMDNSSATSGPGIGNPTTPACPGCLIKYSFLGYNSLANLSTIPKSIPASTGTLNTCTNATPVTIDGTNNFLWVPITGPDGNIVAEINAMGQSLGLITTSFYQKSGGGIRARNSVKYLDRNITINPANNSFSIPVKVRLYFSKQEFIDLDNDPTSGVATFTDLKILKNNDPCGAIINSTTIMLNPTNNTVPANYEQGTNSYVLQVDVTSFSSFYFAASNVTLPVDKINFGGTLQPDLTTKLNWNVENEINSKAFVVQRSTDANQFTDIGNVNAVGNNTPAVPYQFVDADAANQQATKVYYRLKIFSNDGSFKYSNIISILLPINKAFITIAPNPVVNVLKANIISPTAANTVVRVYNNTGSIVYQTILFINKGNNQLSLPLYSLASGSYYIDISGKGIVSKASFEKR